MFPKCWSLKGPDFLSGGLMTCGSGVLESLSAFTLVLSGPSQSIRIPHE